MTHSSANRWVMAFLMSIASRYRNFQMKAPINLNGTWKIKMRKMKWNICFCDESISFRGWIVYSTVWSIEYVNVIQTSVVVFCSFVHYSIAYYIRYLLHDDCLVEIQTLILKSRSLNSNFNIDLVDNFVFFSVVEKHKHTNYFILIAISV